MNKPNPLSPMNLAVLVGVYDPEGGGAERSTSQIVDHLIDRGHKVTIITGYCSPEVEIPGATIDRFTKKWPSSPWWLWSYARWAQRRVIQGGFDSSLSVATAVPAAVVQPRGGTVRETLQRNIDMRPSAVSRVIKQLLLKLSVKQQMLLMMERKTLKDLKVKRIVALSGYVMKQLKQHYSVDESRIRLIRNAAVAPDIDDKTRHIWRVRVRCGFNISDDALVYVFAAHNPRLKGIDPLLRASKECLDKGIDLVLMLAGKIGYGCQHLATKLGIRDRVRIVGTTNRMAELYAAADVTVLPTFYDPSSKVVIESLMMGVPTISTSFNGASEFICNEGHSPRGRVIDNPADVPALVQAMVDLADPAERRRCTAAMNGLADSLSIGRHVVQLEQVLAEAASDD